jgi:preprotein translocase subunit SecD
MLTELQDNARRVLREARIGFMDLAVRGESVEVRIREGNDLQQALIKLDETPFGSSHDNTIVVQDVGERLVRLTLTEHAVDERSGASLRRSIEILERRLAELHIDAGGVQRDGDDHILVLLPGVKDAAPIARLLSSRAKLTFRMVDESVSPEQALKGQLPPTDEIVYGTRKEGKIPYVLEKRIVIDSEDLADAQPSFDQQHADQPIVTFKFNSRGKIRFANATTENVGRRFAIVLDDEVVSAPVIQTPILGGSGQISGSFTIEEAVNLAMLLQSGTLPVRLNLIEQSVVEAKPPNGQ